MNLSSDWLTAGVKDRHPPGGWVTVGHTGIMAEGSGSDCTVVTILNKCLHTSVV